VAGEEFLECGLPGLRVRAHPQSDHDDAVESVVCLCGRQPDADAHTGGLGGLEVEHPLQRCGNGQFAVAGNDAFCIRCGGVGADIQRLGDWLAQD
jgi:hypothetical protein